MKIEFDSSLYSISAIKKALKDYRNLADFACEDKKNKFLVNIRSIGEKELEPLFRQEFCNYVLALTGTLK